MKEIILHIGYGKTGSSALQSWLALNNGLLEKQGIHYAGLNDQAKVFGVSSGNARGLIDYLDGRKKEDFVLNYYFSGYKKAIISGEALQNLGGDRARVLNKFLKKNRISITIIAFIRDIYNHNYSNYVQAVKRKGYLLGFSEWSKTYLNADTIKFYFELSKYFDVNLVYYEQYIDNLAIAFCRETKIKYDNLNPMLSRKVNRTLSYCEILVLQDFGRLALSAGIESNVFSRIISDDLVNIYPGVKSLPFLFPEIQKQIDDLFLVEIDKFNQISIEKYGFEIKNISDVKYLKSINNEEINISLERIVKIISQRTSYLGSKSLLMMAKNYRNTNRKIALKFVFYAALSATTMLLKVVITPFIDMYKKGFGMLSKRSS